MKTKKLLLTSVLLIINSTFFVFHCSAQFTKLLDFVGANGSSPQGSLISDGVFLYGMTSNAGANSAGTIFKIKPDGTGYVQLFDFGGTNGSTPRGSLVSDGTFLYGMTSAGGADGDGIIFKIMPDGTGFAKLLDFGTSTANGITPYGDLIYDGTFLYGMNSYGGANNDGTIFKIKPDGTGYVTLLDFAGNTNGSRPLGSFISDGTFLYGMTQAGGVNNSGGTVFKIKPDGTGYSKLYDFRASSTDGFSPWGSLVSDGTFLYGMTELGGANNVGTIFKIKTDGTSYTKLLDFATSTNGNHPQGSFIYDGNFLYAMVNVGSGGNGNIFKIKPDGTGYADLFDFNGSNAGSPTTNSLLSDGTALYGMTPSGGTNYAGVVFKLSGSMGGIKETTIASKISIYPNPTNGKAQLSVINMQLVKGELKIYNVTGECIHQQNFCSSNIDVDLSSQPKGIYFLQLRTPQGIGTKKLVVQ